MIRQLLASQQDGATFYVIHYNFAETLERFNNFRAARRFLLDFYTED